MTSNDKKLIKIFKSLPEGFWDFKDVSNRELVHGIHSYPAVMIYPISRNIIQFVQSIMRVNSLLDPFSGSGTVLVEGIHSGIPKVYGNDINPLAILLSEVKTNVYNIKSLDSEICVLKHNINLEYRKYTKLLKNINSDFEKKYNLSSKRGWGDNAPELLTQYLLSKNIKLEVPSFKNIGYWFKPGVIIELQIIKNCINKIKNRDLKKFVYVAFSEIIKTVSNRRNGEFKMYRISSEKISLHNPDVRKEFERTLDRNIEKVKDFNKYIMKNKIHTKVSISNDDASTLKSVRRSSIDLIVTSPPYGDSRTTVAYGEFSRLSLQWMDLYELSDKEIMNIDKTLLGGVKYRHGFDYDLSSKTLKKSLNIINKIDMERCGDVYSFYKDLEKTIKTCSEKTKKGGYQFWVVGNRTVKNELLKTDIIISEIASNYNMDYVYTIKRNISNKTMPSKNSPSNICGKTVSTMCNEHIVVLRKR